MRPVPALIAALIAAACTDASVPTSSTVQRPGAASFSRNGGAASFTTIDVPGAVMMFPLDINDHGVIVGRYGLAGHTHGFIRDESGTISQIDVPGSSFTVAGAINDSGVVAGWYILPAAPAVRHGFVLRGGVFTTIDPSGSTFTNLLGINERGDISGRFCTRAVCHLGGGDFRGFIYHDGEFTYVDVPGGDDTSPFKIAASGVFGGAFTKVGVSEQLFVYKRGDYATFALPNGKPVTEDNGGFNSRGDLVGTYCVSTTVPCLIAPTGVRGFLMSDGEMTPIDVPGAVATAAAGINARGDIVGCYFDEIGAAHGFLRGASHGS
jgi:uncharacterized membrane protein